MACVSPCKASCVNCVHAAVLIDELTSLPATVPQCSSLTGPPPQDLSHSAGQPRGSVHGAMLSKVNSAVDCKHCGFGSSPTD